MALNGFMLIQHYRQRREDGSEFLGRNVFTAYPKTGETLWYGFDSYGFPPESPARGVARHRFTPDGDALTHEIDVRLGEDHEFSPFMRARYTRKNG